MDRELKTLLGIMATAIIVMIAMSNLSLVTDLHTYRLTLTTEGCAYAKSIGLQVDKANGQCSVQARFRPHKISSGGVLHLDDDKTIAITDSMLLATAPLDTDLPMTQAQRDGLKWFWVLIGVAIAVGGAAFYFLGRKPVNKREE
ncbi:MAG: hypothetical protein WA135_15455 [Thiobacillus sp.]